MTTDDIAQWIESFTHKTIQLRDYQVEAWRRLWTERCNGRKRALIHLATGLGKTSVAAVDVLHYIQVENPGSRVLFVSHMNDISHQARQTFLRIHPAFTTSFFRPAHGFKNVEVTFATFQGLYQNLDSI